MKKCLEKISFKLFYFNNNEKISGLKPGLFGNCTGLRGDCTDLFDDVDQAEITKQEQDEGIDIQDLIT